MKSILLHINADSGQDARLEAALDVVRAFDAHLICVQVSLFNAFVMADPYGAVYPELFAELDAAQEAEKVRIEDRLAREGVSWEWLQVNDAPVHLIVSQARLADLVVLSKPPHGRTDPGRPLSIAADIAIHSRAPVLAVPPEIRRFDCAGAAAVAWNGSFEAAHALRLTVPMLRAASEVHLITVSEDKSDFPATDASVYLARHGISSELHEKDANGRLVAEALASVVARVKAEYLIAGAYGHSRVRETILGGVTRDLLHHGSIPLVLAH